MARIDRSTYRTAGLREIEGWRKAGLPVVRLTAAELDGLPDYSCSLPTGVTIGKRWKRRIPYMTAYVTAEETLWLLGEYKASENPDEALACFSVIEVMTPRQAQVRDELALQGAGRPD